MNDSDSPPNDVIDIALAEDLGAGDVTSQFLIPEAHQSRGRIIAREPAIVAGVQTAGEVFKRVDPHIQVVTLKESGASIGRNETVLEVSGSTRSILGAERVALNFLQRLSGVATLTRRYVDAVAGTRAIILDTRKTTPGLRALEKAAVKAGRGQNHRFGLFDMVMIKDNHLHAVVDREKLREIIRQLRDTRPDLRIEIEADTLEQVRDFLEWSGADVILLDNMAPPQLAEAVRLGEGKTKFEASGGVTLENVREVAETGVDYISVGALTHSAPAIDFSLELE
jgi:nicotinate-nucleotide pyrophosphorylase (carboxylating)